MVAAWWLVTLALLAKSVLTALQCHTSMADDLYRPSGNRSSCNCDCSCARLKFWQHFYKPNTQLSDLALDFNNSTVFLHRWTPALWDTACQAHKMLWQILLVTVARELSCSLVLHTCQGQQEHMQ